MHAPCDGVSHFYKPVTTSTALCATYISGESPGGKQKWLLWILLCYSVYHTCKATVPDTTTSSTVQIWKTTFEDILTLCLLWYGRFARSLLNVGLKSADDQRRKLIWEDSFCPSPTRGKYILNVKSQKATDTSTLLHFHQFGYVNPLDVTSLSLFSSYKKHKKDGRGEN